MSTTVDKLNYLNETKSSIKESIINKGVNVSNSDTFQSYAEKISQIETGKSSIILSNDDPYNVTNDQYLIKRLIKEIDLTDVNFNARSLDNMFSYFESLEKIIWPSSFDVSDSDSISTMFRDCKSLKTIDLSSWKGLSSISNCSYAFFGCESLTEAIIKNINANNTEYMFNNCKSLLSLDMSSWSDGIRSTSYMFWGCESLKSLKIYPLNLDECSSMYNMFYNCTSLTDVDWGIQWASNSNITNFDISYSPISRDSILDLFNQLASKTGNPTLKISSTTESYVTSSEIAIATNKGWTVTT